MLAQLLKRLDARLNDLGPNRDAHNERIKLIAGSLNAIGVAALIGGVVSPLFDVSRVSGALSVLIGLSMWVGFSFAAYQILGYIRSRE